MFIATRESKHLYSIKTGEVPFGYVYRGLSGETWYVSIDEKAKHYLAGDKLEQAFDLIENYLKGRG